MKKVTFRNIPQDGTYIRPIGYVKPDTKGFLTVELQDEVAERFEKAWNIVSIEPIVDEETEPVVDKVAEPVVDEETASEEKLDLESMKLKDIQSIALEAGLSQKDINGVKKADLIEILNKL